MEYVVPRHRSLLVKVCYLLGSTLFSIVTLLCLQLPASAKEAPVEVFVPDTVMYVSGQTAPNARVTIQRDGATIGTATANAQGEFTKKLGAQPFGLKTIQVYSQDLKGRLTDTVGQTLNIKAQADTYIDFFLPPAFSLSTNNIEEGSGLIVGGSAYPNSTVTVNIDNNYTVYASTNARGEWQSTIDTNNFFIGSHIVSTLVTDKNGSKSLSSLAKRFSVFGQPEIIKSPKIPVIEEPFDGQQFATRNIVVSGRAQRNTQLELFANDKIVGSVFTNSLGEWTIPLSLFANQTELRARECASGSCSDFSDTVTVSYTGNSTQNGIELELNDYSLLVQEDIKLRVNAKITGGNAPYEVNIDWGDGMHSRRSQLQKGVSSIDYTYLEVGRYNAVITVTDSDGNTVTQYFTVQVTPLTGGLLGNVWWLMLGGFLVVYAIEHYIKGMWLQRHKHGDSDAPHHIPH